MIEAREAGDSIEPRVERGFASATLGSRTKKRLKPAKRATGEREPTSMLVDVLSESIVCRPLRGLEFF
jgi:hypothetical protein